jgi:hypothetical protein
MSYSYLRATLTTEQCTLAVQLIDARLDQSDYDSSTFVDLFSLRCRIRSTKVGRKRQAGATIEIKRVTITAPELVHLTELLSSAIQLTAVDSTHFVELFRLRDYLSRCTQYG